MLTAQANLRQCGGRERLWRPRRSLPRVQQLRHFWR